MDSKGESIGNGPSFSNGPGSARDWRTARLNETQVTHWGLV